MTKEERIKGERAVLAFNLSHPVGARVVVDRDSGEQFETRTRSEAFVSAAGHPVIWVEGISGYYSLEKVRAA